MQAAFHFLRILLFGAPQFRLTVIFPIINVETGLHAEDRRGEKTSMHSTQNKQLGLLSDPFSDHLVMREKGKIVKEDFTLVVHNGFNLNLH